MAARTSARSISFPTTAHCWGSLAASSIRVRWVASLGDARALTTQLVDALRLSREASRPLEAIRLRCLASEALIKMGEPQRARQFARPLRHTSGRLLPPLLAARLALARVAADGRTDLAALVTTEAPRPHVS